MFRSCNSLLELNAARIKECNKPNADFTAINNAYNERRAQILQNSVSSFKRVVFKQIVVEQGPKYRTLPINGVSDRLGVIQLKSGGFYL